MNFVTYLGSATDCSPVIFELDMLFSVEAGPQNQLIFYMLRKKVVFYYTKQVSFKCSFCT